MRNVSDKVTQKVNVHSLYSVMCLQSSRLKDNVEKICRVELETDNNITHVHCMLGT
jgi:hypothetical protein